VSLTTSPMRFALVWLKTLLHRCSDHVATVTGKLAFLACRQERFRVALIESLCRDYPGLLVEKLFKRDPQGTLEQAVQLAPELVGALVRNKQISENYLRAMVEYWHDTDVPQTTLELIAELVRNKQISEGCLRAMAEYWHDTDVPRMALDLVHYATGTSMGYGQEGEDLILLRLLNASKPGYYVDIGAHHPIRFSNTYTLYRAGWRGLNVDATPGSMERFRALRLRDINVECAVSGTAQPMLFHVFEEGALNTFDATLAAEYVRQGWKLLRTQEITPWPLSALLDEHLPEGQSIDLMNIDVEGEELSVLASNDWERYRPGTIVLEVLNTSLAHLEAAPTVKFLRGKGYVPVAKLLNSTILQLEA